MLLPYLLTNGVIGSDALGIAESGNGIPDIVDEARNEVDFWLSLRHEGGYSHGLSNPDESTNILYQADNTAIAAWANAVNAAMLAAALRIANKSATAKHYEQAALEAWNYASQLPDQMLNDGQDLGSGTVTGLDFRMTAAAWLYHLTGNAEFENLMAEDALVTSGTSEFMTADRNQLYGMVAYLHTDQTINFPDLQNNMRAAVIHQAKEKEVSFSQSRPSRRASDNNYGWLHTTQNVHRTIVAHSVAENTADLTLFKKAMVLEADWGLSRNPANIVQMTTATTRLETLRSIEQANTRFVYDHSEFTPQQNMRGKMALYGYLLGMSR